MNHGMSAFRQDMHASSPSGPDAAAALPMNFSLRRGLDLQLPCAPESVDAVRATGISKPG